MSLRIENVTVDCADPVKLAAFWAGSLGYVEAEWNDHAGAKAFDPDHLGPSMLFMPVPEGKVVKNRVHVDLVPTQSMALEVDRLISLGATIRVEYNSSEGPMAGTWTVMADPEGNEFCVGLGPEDERT